MLFLVPVGICDRGSVAFAVMSGVYHYSNPTSCESTSPYSTGKLAYESSSASPPAGPLDGGTYSSGNCAYDRFDIGASGFETEPLLETGPLPASESLAQLSPELRYDTWETYRADAANI